MKLDGYRVRLAEPADEPQVLALFESGPEYFELISGAPPDRAEFQTLLAELPPGKAYEDKFVFCVFAPEGRLAAIAEMIRGYPEPGIWFIGLLFVAKDLRGQGLGRAILKSIIAHVAANNGRAIRIAVAEQNEAAMRFWPGNGFVTLYIAERERERLEPLLLHVMERMV